MFILMISLLSVSAAFAATDTYQGTVVEDSGYIGVQTPGDGFIAFDDQAMSPSLLNETWACLGRSAIVKVEDRGMLVDLLSISCQ